MPSVRISKKDKESLLTKLRNGFDVESGGSALGLSGAQIRIARDKYGSEIIAAFKIGSARFPFGITGHHFNYSPINHAQNTEAKIGRIVDGTTKKITHMQYNP